MHKLQAVFTTETLVLLLLQNDRSSADLIVKLASTGIKSSNALGQMYALYDGTKQSLRTTPDISLFSNKISSESLSDHAVKTVHLYNTV